MLNPGDVVVVRFPYAESKGYKWRPALVISTAAFHKKYDICWVAMITSADNPAWPGDIPIIPLKDTGLSAPSCIRPAKIATIQYDAAKIIGRVPAKFLSNAKVFIRAQLANKS